MTLFTRTSACVLGALLVVSLAGCPKKQGSGKTTANSTGGTSTAGKPAAAEKPLSQAEVKQLAAQAKGMFGPLPAEAVSTKNPITPAKVDLGRMLWYDTRFSKGHQISCDSCHGLSTYGVDNKPLSEGHNKQLGDRNAPTVYNAALESSQFWDARAPTVEAQAKMPVLNPKEMAMPSAAFVVQVLESIPGYAPLFKKAFPKAKAPITFDHFADAIGAFERKLITPGPFDQFMNGKLNALTTAEVRGLKTFIQTGCTTCHMGTLLGGSLNQKMGLMKPYPGLKDKGVGAATKNPALNFFFKVPQLRNVAKTAPYMSDGSIKTLPKMVHIMAEYQLGKTLTDAQVASIVTFLHSLTGKIDAKFIAKPTLPKSGPNTPKAQK